MSYTQEWKQVEALVERLSDALAPVPYPQERPVPDTLQAVLTLAALGVEGAVRAIRAERTAIYEQMRTQVDAFMQQHGTEPSAILCNNRDLSLAMAPYGMTTVGVDPHAGGPRDFLFQGTKVLPYKPEWGKPNRLHDIIAVGEERAASRL